jgi:hypothetical protein
MPRKRKIERVWRFLCEGVEIFNLEGTDATREIITGRRNHVVGAHFSMKMRGHLLHEGGVEELFVKNADCILRAKKVWAQPETIRMNLFAGFANEIYTSDYLVEEDAGFVRYEVKQWIELRPPKAAAWDGAAQQKWEDAKVLRARLKRIRVPIVRQACPGASSRSATSAGAAIPSWWTKSSPTTGGISSPRTSTVWSRN